MRWVLHSPAGFAADVPDASKRVCFLSRQRFLPGDLQEVLGEEFQRLSPVTLVLSESRTTWQDREGIDAITHSDRSFPASVN
jgi:hypothetical protein